MYGMVNKALEGSIRERWGEDSWERVRRRAGVDVEVFVSNDGYPDEMTYRLVGAASEEFGVTADELLEHFGVYWINRVALDCYGDLMRSGGRTMRDFLINLPNFHTRVRLFFPHLAPPQFRCSDVAEGGLRFHYYSHRPGLAPFVMGLLRGLGEMFRTPVEVRLDRGRERGADHDEFIVSWGAPGQG